jgi:hypothetical protein
MRKLTNKILLVALVILLLSSITASLRVAAQQTRVYVDPPSIIDEGLVPDTTFNITVKIENAPEDPGVVGIEFKLTWNASLLEGVSMVLPVGHFMTPDGDEGNLWKLKHDVKPDYVHYAYAFLDIQAGIDQGYLPKSGDGTIAIITLKVKATGSCILHFSTTKVGDPDAEEIPHEASDGYFENLPPQPPPAAKLYVDPPGIVDPTLVPCESFLVNVSIANATDVYSFELKLGFDPNVLNATSVELGDFFPSSVVPLEEINNVVGYVLFSATLESPEPPKSGNGTLAAITFHVEDFGASALELFDTSLEDQTGEPLSHSTADGNFNNIPAAAKLYVDPPSIVDPTLVPSENFLVNVSIANATEVYSFEFKLGFDPNVLNATSVELGDFFPSSVVPLEEINNVVGYVLFSATLESPEPPKSGNGTLAAITFHVEDFGASALELFDTSLGDQTGEPLSHSTADGSFNNILLAKLYVDPPEIIDPTLLPSSTFTINVTIDDVENLHVCEFNLTYNTEIISWLGVTVHTVLGEVPVAKILGDDEIGFLWIKLTYPNAITTYSPIALVTLLFHVDAMGSTPLDLHDTELSDPTSEPIYHEAYDGFFLTAIRDVAVVNVVPSPTDLYEGRTVNISVTVGNEGDIAETFNVTVYFDDTLIGTITVTDLGSKENTTITINWNTEGVPACHTYTIRAEAASVPYEIDLTNNFFTDGSVRIRILGDLNGDGIVDMYDTLQSSNAFGSYLGHPRWDPWADLNGDDEVDIYDEILLAANFGRTC